MKNWQSAELKIISAQNYAKLLNLSNKDIAYLFSTLQKVGVKNANN